MRSGPDFSLLLFWIPALVALVAGVLFLRRGVRGSRRGKTPRCRKCDYALVGLASERCPECGATLDLNNIVYGERVRHPWVAAVGAALGVTGVFFVVSPTTFVFPHFDWYPPTPTGWG